MDLTPLVITVKVAGVATVAALFVGVSLAYALAKARFLGKDLLDALVTLPMVLPPTVLGYYLVVLLGRRGWLGAWLLKTFDYSLMFTWQGAAVASAIVSIPLVFKSSRAAFEGVDPQLENAARTLGLSEPAVFLRVSLPLAWRGILAGTMLAFARAMGEFGATLMVAGNLPGKTQTLSLAIYTAVESGNEGLAANLVLITSLVCICVLVASGKLLRTALP